MSILKELQGLSESITNGNNLNTEYAIDTVLVINAEKYYSNP